MPLNLEPFSRTFESDTKRTKIAECIERYAPNNLPPGTDLLDLGCGNGYGLTVLRQKYQLAGEIMGLTINRKERKAARSRSLKVMRGDMHAMPFRSRRFGFIFTQDTLEHSISPYIALTEVNRVLKPGGLALLSIPVDTDQFDAWYHFWTPTSEQLTAFARKCGFEIVNMQRVFIVNGDFLVALICKIAEHDPQRVYEEALEHQNEDGKHQH